MTHCVLAKAERGDPTANGTEKATYGKIEKSRYGSVSSYISECVDHYPGYNDKDLIHDKDIYQTLVGGKGFCNAAEAQYTGRNFLEVA